MQIKFPDGNLKTCLIPVAGFLNHSVCLFSLFGMISNFLAISGFDILAGLQIHPHVVKYGKVDVETSSLKFPLSRPCKRGEQCFLSYGNYCSSHLLTFYGFLPKGDNPYDIIPLGSSYLPLLIILKSLRLSSNFCLKLCLNLSSLQMLMSLMMKTPRVSFLGQVTCYAGLGFRAITTSSTTVCLLHC